MASNISLGFPIYWERERIPEEENAKGLKRFAYINIALGILTSSYGIFLLFQEDILRGASFTTFGSIWAMAGTCCILSAKCTLFSNGFFHREESLTYSNV